MKKINLVILWICLVVFVTYGVSASTVTRDLSTNRIDQGGIVDVTLTIDIIDTEGFYIIDELIPQNMIVTNAGTGNTNEAGHIKWTVIDNIIEDINLVYQLQDISNIKRNASFYGTYIFQSDYTNELDILGDNTLIIYTPTEEVCDGIDNDYDGLIDEDLTQSTNELGACSINTETCDAGNYVPNKEYITQEETCNNIDDDCNGLIDEDSNCKEPIYMYGGETWYYNFPECDTLKLNITTTDNIDDGEYNITSNCEVDRNNSWTDKINYWECDCYDNYNFTVKFHPGAVNNYTFTFNYMYEEYVQDEDTGGNGGGGYIGGGGVFTATLKLNESVIKMLRVNMISRFNINNKQHTVKITEIGDGYVTVDIQSEIKTLNLTLNEKHLIDFEDDNYYDLAVTLKTISGKTARIEFEHIDEYYETKIINETIPTIPINETEPIEDIDLPIEEEEEKSSKTFWIVLMVIIVILLIIGGIWYFFNK